ncbi:integumentary mucin A.1-like isoform X2 [Clavelina lepadiformis]|uniref:integumentary mucin A.1-like isoform X2 n=1 Tax=Clavelina lepadiformis TaxID=159417 RepID=UPI004043464D
MATLATATAVAVLTAQVIFANYALTEYLQPNIECQAYRCSVPVDKRIDASPGEILRDRCLSNGFCFDNSKFGKIWCFQPLVLAYDKCPHAECQVIPERRETCNPGGLMTRDNCIAAGCCFDEDSYDAPICFKRKVYPVGFPGRHTFYSHLVMRICNRQDPKNRKQCGSKKISRDECLRHQCCWLPVVLEGPQCYHFG